jgi:hypothetical protein
MFSLKLSFLSFYSINLFNLFVASHIRADRDALNTTIHGMVIHCCDMIDHLNILGIEVTGLY